MEAKLQLQNFTYPNNSNISVPPKTDHLTIFKNSSPISLPSFSTSISISPNSTGFHYSSSRRSSSSRYPRASTIVQCPRNKFADKYCPPQLSTAPVTFAAGGSIQMISEAVAVRDYENEK